jgi:hypothetical protein
VTSSPSLIQEGDIAPAVTGGDTYYPAIDIDPNMNVGVTFIESAGTLGSSGGEFPSMYITGRSPTDPTGTMQPPVLVFAGTADNTTGRGGEIASVAIDPSTGNFWACNEFITGSAPWSEGIANFSISPGQGGGGAGLATGTFFIDGNNQLWMYRNGAFTNTGGFAKVFSGGVDLSGNPEVWFLDGNNQLWKWDNGTFTNTGGFAMHIAAGRGFVAFSDGVNQLWTFTDGGNGFTNTGGFASRFTAGFAAFSNQIDFADGINQLWTFNTNTNQFTNTGGFTKLFVAGQDTSGRNEIWFTDGNNQVWRLDNGTFTNTGGFATVIQGALGQLYFADGIHQIWSLSDAGTFTNTGGFASVISSNPATSAVFFADGINQVWMYQNGVFTDTGGFTLRLSAF